MSEQSCHCDRTESALVTCPQHGAPDQTDRGELVEALAGAVWRHVQHHRPEYGDSACTCGEWEGPMTVTRGPRSFAYHLAEALAPTVAALMTEHAARVAGERDELRARVEGVKALLDSWPIGDNGQDYRRGVNQARDALRAALAGDGEGETGRSEALSADLRAEQASEVSQEGGDSAGLREAEKRPAAVWVSPRRLGGEPCINGTRLPTHLIAALVWDAGVDLTLSMYPSIDADEALIACWFEVVHGKRRKWRKTFPDWPRRWDEDEWRARGQRPSEARQGAREAGGL